MSKKSAPGGVDDSCCGGGGGGGGEDGAVSGSDVYSQEKKEELMKKLSSFRLRVLAACKQIPKGSFSTYGELAKALGTSARPVGTALKNNPFAPVVPCHRILASDFSIGGFAGATDKGSAEIKRKIQMLEREGVSFGPDGRVNPAKRAKLYRDFVEPTRKQLEPAELGKPVEPTAATSRSSGDQHE